MFDTFHQLLYVHINYTPRRILQLIVTQVSNNKFQCYYYYFLVIKHLALLKILSFIFMIIKITLYQYEFI